MFQLLEVQGGVFLRSWCSAPALGNICKLFKPSSKHIFIDLYRGVFMGKNIKVAYMQRVIHLLALWTEASGFQRFSLSAAVQRGRIPPSHSGISPNSLAGGIAGVGPGHIGADYFNGQPVSELISQLLRAEPYPPSRYGAPYGQAQMQASASGASVMGIDSICELAARLLFSTIEWARNIPYFPELPVSEQVRSKAR